MTGMSSASLDERGVAIVGVGLIGGSIAAALRTHGYTGSIVGVGRNEARIQAAARQGLLTLGTTDIAEAASQASLFVFCTPVDHIAQGIREAAAISGRGTLFTDAGSVKESICRALADGMPDGREFVGSHPIAGSEKRGFEHAIADLFQDRTCVVTPTDSTSENARQRVTHLWRCLGSEVIELTPAEHDRRLALTSHLPHVIAASLARILDESAHPFTGSGFRDTTRIAGGDPKLWTAICKANGKQILSALDCYQSGLQEFREALASENEGRLRTLLADAQTKRESLD